MTIFNEETFSLKSGLQKGPRKLKIKNLQWIKMLKDAKNASDHWVYVWGREGKLLDSDF